MVRVLFFLSLATMFSLHAQVTCESLRVPGTTYSLVACKNGTGKLFYTDTAITNRFKYKQFSIKLVSELSETEKADVKKYKLPLKPTDTVIVYDWDILHQAKMGYFGPAIGRVHIQAKDSTIKIYKYLLKPETKDYVPVRFKIIRMGMDNFIFYDMDHPYLNINYYFKKKYIFTSDK